MKAFYRKLCFSAFLLAALFVAAPSLYAAQAPAKGDKPAAEAKAPEADSSQGVTFVNRSRDTQNVLAVFGGAEKCEEMKERAQVAIEAGQTSAVESGANPICWCASTLGKVGSCTIWNKAKPGKQVTLR